MTRGVLQSRTLGRMGRWGNAVFQWIFLKTYSITHSLEIRGPRWLGDDIYGFEHADCNGRLPLVREKPTHGIDDTIIPHLNEPLCDAEVEGYFQYHTSYYRGYRESIRHWFRQPLEPYWSQVAAAAGRMRELGPEMIGVHIRRGDYGRGMFYITPIEWYVEALRRIGAKRIFVATEDESLLDSLAEFHPVTAKQLGVTLRSDAPNGVMHLAKDLADRNEAALNFFPDWYLLQQCETLLMPNSTFSMSAALTGLCTRAMRSDPATGRIEPIDLWNCMPMQFIKQADYQHVPGLYLKENPYW